MTALPKPTILSGFSIFFECSDIVFNYRLGVFADELAPIPWRQDKAPNVSME